jgi:hypothetical protein
VSDIESGQNLPVTCPDKACQEEPGFCGMPGLCSE